MKTAMPTDPLCIIFTTCSSQQEADTIASALVEKRLAACVQCEPIHSTYRWEKAIERENERRLTIKTRRALYDAVEKEIVSLHSYDVPEILCVAVDTGLGPYCDWIREQT